jgi:hypothetical protein
VGGCRPGYRPGPQAEALRQIVVQSYYRDQAGHLYQLAGRPVMVRSTADPEALAEMERAVRVARWLGEEGFPANRVLPEAIRTGGSRRGWRPF